MADLQWQRLRLPYTLSHLPPKKEHAPIPSPLKNGAFSSTSTHVPFRKWNRHRCWFLAPDVDCTKLENTMSRITTDFKLIAIVTSAFLSVRFCRELFFLLFFKIFSRPVCQGLVMFYELRNLKMKQNRFYRHLNDNCLFPQLEVSTGEYEINKISPSICCSDTVNSLKLLKYLSFFFFFLMPFDIF